MGTVDGLVLCTSKKHHHTFAAFPALLYELNPCLPVFFSGGKISRHTNTVTISNYEQEFKAHNGKQVLSRLRILALDTASLIIVWLDGSQNHHLGLWHIGIPVSRLLLYFEIHFFRC